MWATSRRRVAGPAPGWGRLASMDERGLRLVGAPNTRDLGGVRTADGRTVRRGLLLRSGALGRLTDDDLLRLGEQKIAWLIDLRDASEIDAAPPDRLPGPPTPQVRHIPVFDPGHPLFTYVSALLMGRDVTAYEGSAEEGSPGAMLRIYRWMVADPGARAGFAEALRTIADADEPVLYHCSAGKDRTGWLTAVLLELLGVDRDVIMADYLGTNEYSRAAHASIIEAMRAKGRPADPTLLLPL